MFPSTKQPQKPYPIKPHTSSHALHHEQTCKTGAIFRLRGRDYCKRSGGKDDSQKGRVLGRGMWRFGPHLFLANSMKGGRKAEQIHQALVVNQLLMREKEKH